MTALHHYFALFVITISSFVHRRTSFIVVRTCCSAVKVNTDEAGDSIYAIAHQDIDLSQSPQEITGQIEFLRWHLIGSLDALPNQPISQSHAAVTLRQDHQFCSRCGTPTELHPIENATVCPRCHYHQYPESSLLWSPPSSKPPRIKPQILLAHHLRATDSKMYTVLAGFVEVGELRAMGCCIVKWWKRWGYLSAICAISAANLAFFPAI